MKKIVPSDLIASAEVIRSIICWSLLPEHIKSVEFFNYILVLHAVAPVFETVGLPNLILKTWVLHSCTIILYPSIFIGINGSLNRYDPAKVNAFDMGCESGFMTAYCLWSNFTHKDRVIIQNIVVRVWIFMRILVIVFDIYWLLILIAIYWILISGQWMLIYC